MAACVATIAVAVTAAACSPSLDEGEGADPVATAARTRASITQPALEVETTAASATPTTAADETSETITTPASAACTVGPVPPSAGLDPFYTHGCQVDGFWVVANEVVDPLAIVRAADTIDRIFAADERVAPLLTDADIRLGIIGRDQRTTEMPEYRDLNEVFPETDWDTRARGLGATAERPLVSAGEENVLCLAGDRYLGEDILVHEFSHVLHEFGYRTLDPDFEADLLAAYERAVEDGTWAATYAATNHHEYWAEGVQSFLERNLTADPADGVHGPIDTAAELADADPALFALIDRWLGSVELPPQCQRP